MQKLETRPMFPKVPIVIWQVFWWMRFSESAPGEMRHSGKELFPEEKVMTQVPLSFLSRLKAEMNLKKLAWVCHTH